MCCGGVKRLSRQKRILLTDILVKIRDTLSGRKPSLQAGGCWAEDISRQSEPGLEQQKSPVMLCLDNGHHSAAMIQYQIG